MQIWYFLKKFQYLKNFKKINFYQNQFKLIITKLKKKKNYKQTNTLQLVSHKATLDPCIWSAKLLTLSGALFLTSSQLRACKSDFINTQAKIPLSFSLSLSLSFFPLLLQAMLISPHHSRNAHKNQLADLRALNFFLFFHHHKTISSTVKKQTDFL